MDKNISIIGVGKLGLCFALTLEKAGYNVLGADLNDEYINQLNNKTFNSSEPHVNDFLKNSKNFKATTSIEEAVNFSDTLFVLVATPSLPNGKYNHIHIENVVNRLMNLNVPKNKKHLIIGCTVMPGFCKNLQTKLKQFNYEISYNPEFIAQGSILKDQQTPDMVLIGEGSKEGGDIIEELYRNMCSNTPVIERMDTLSAEITKISLNCFLTTKIAYANMIGDIAIQSGANPEAILKAIGNDTRIGSKYLKYGFGFGGPCFPRDNRSLYIYADEIGYDAKISKVVDPANEIHLKFQVMQFMKDNPNKHNDIVIDSVTYKKNSKIIDESQQLLFAVELAKNGYNIIIKESKNIIESVKKIYGDLFRYIEN